CSTCLGHHGDFPSFPTRRSSDLGTPVLLLQLLLGLQPDRRRHALQTVAPLELPSWAGTIRLSGIRAFDRLWDARLDDGRVRVEEDRKSTRLNSSHQIISYAVFCL